MKALTAAQMGEVDRLTIAAGIPGLILMENAGSRVTELVQEVFSPLGAQRIVVLCGKGNNGGDGFVVARQLFTRLRPRALDVVLCGQPEELKGDAAENFRMLVACGCPWSNEIPTDARMATLVVDAVLGSGLKGPAKGRALEMIRAINHDFPLAKVVAVDIPSGLDSDSGESGGEWARADYTVTFTAPKIAHVLPPNCDRMGQLRVAQIGTPPALLEREDFFLDVVETQWFHPMFLPRQRDAHKGTFGHVLVVAGSVGKTGAAAMTGLSALRAGAGLVTVASAESAAPSVAAHAAELMTEGLAETDAGSISLGAFEYGRIEALAKGKDVIAAGPGLGTHPDTVEFVRRLVAQFSQPMVLDADALNALAGTPFRASGLRILTPHPGEMARLSGGTVPEIQRDRVNCARGFARERGVMVVLKGYRTLIAFPDGKVWINTSGTPALATGGTGDVLTGLIAGLLAQFPEKTNLAVAAAVYLHGRAGQLGADALGEKSLIATDLLQFLPEAMDELACLPD